MNKLPEKFCKWVEEKGYGKLYALNQLILYEHTSAFKEIHHPTKQMFIGYMAEYLIEKTGGGMSNLDRVKNINNLYLLYINFIESIK